MAAGIAAAGGRLLQAIASGRRRTVDRIGGSRAICALLVVCAGCASSSGQATSAGRAISLRADTLMLKPVDRGRLSSGYGIRYHPILKTRQMHPGIDWAAPRGTPVRAAGNGVVIAAERFGAYGYYVRIEHGRTVATTYAHLDSYAPGLRPGRLVRQGDLLGRVGSSGRATGPHLHYEILVAGHQVDPLAVSPVMHAHAANSAGVRGRIRGRARHRRPRRRRRRRCCARRCRCRVGSGASLSAPRRGWRVDSDRGPAQAPSLTRANPSAARLRPAARSQGPARL